MGKSYAELKLLFGQDRIHLAKALSKREIDSEARGLARQIKGAMGKLPLDSPSSWITTARELGAQVHPMSDDDPRKGLEHGYYCWNSRQIIYDQDWDEWTVCHTLCHELAHHLICHRRVGAIRGGIERFDDDRETLQHRIARRVQEILLG